MARGPLGAVLVALIVVACSAAQTPAPTTLPSLAPTPVPTPAPAGACAAECWPLSGRPLGGADAGLRPIVAKIDNNPLARPYVGINRADIVFETIVEGYATRLAAIFQSQQPERIASIRSARLTDRSLAPMVRGALVYSGTSAYEKPLIQQDAREGKYLDLSADYYAQYGRLTNKPAPNNMYAPTAAMRDIIKSLDPRPVSVPRWPFLSGAHRPQEGGMIAAVPAAGVTFPYRDDFALVTYKYDGASRTYERWQNAEGQPVRSTDALDGKPVAATNVIALFTDIVDVPEIVDASGSTSYNMRLTGTGKASVFRDGLRLDGTWSRKDDNAAFSFTALDGTPVLLAAGQTWVQVVPLSWSVVSN